MPARENSFRPFGSCRPDPFAAWIIGVTRSIPDRWLARRFAFALRRLVTARLRGRPLDVESFGARFRLYPFNNMCEKRILFTPQYFDPAERSALATYLQGVLKQLSTVTFVDIGANIGGYSLFAAACVQGHGRILAIEPQPGIFGRLCFNIESNPGCGVKALSVAVADRDGPLTLFLAPRNKGESSVKLIGFEPGEGTSVTVPATTLVKILRGERLERVDAMKVDVEGAEDLVLLPFFRDAPRAWWPPFLILANTPALWHSDIHALLLAHGYRLLGESRLKRTYDNPALVAAAADVGRIEAETVRHSFPPP